MEPVQCQQGLAMARDIGAARYLECSPHTEKGLASVFEEVIQVSCEFYINITYYNMDL